MAENFVCLVIIPTLAVYYGKLIMKPKTTFGECLKFTPYSWAKLLRMRDLGETEVAGYGITQTEDPLLVTDFVTVKQKCTMATFDLDNEDIAEYSERMMDAGLVPWMYSNILIHTHPGNCPNPSHTDEENFMKAFSHPNWAIMFIIARGGETYCRLKVNTPPGVTKELKVCVDYSHPFPGSEETAWKDEYRQKVSKEEFLWEAYSEPLYCYWDRDGCVVYHDEKTETFYMYDPVNEEWYKDNDGNTKSTKKPNRNWTKQIIEWANQHSSEREIAMIERLDPSDEWYDYIDSDWS